jgi:type IV pilus assembly protein PilV
MTMSMRRCERQLLDKRGFTLLEVLIAITIFSIGLLAVATMQISAVNGNRLGNEVTQATYLAQMQIDALRSSDIATLIAGGPYNDPNNPIDETEANGGIFNRSWVITNRTANSRLVTVTVAWTIGGASHNVVLSTITRGGGN